MFTSPGSRARPGAIGNWRINNEMYVGANVTVNTSTLVVGTLPNTSILANTLCIQVANSSGQTVITPLTYSVGNSTANSFGNSTSDTWANSTANTVINPGLLTLAGAGSNTGFTLGTAVVSGGTGANGYTYLPNGLLMQWGNSIANTAGVIHTFQVPFTTNVLSVQLMMMPGMTNFIGANAAYVSAANSTTFTAKSVSATTANTVMFLAVGH